MSIFEFYIYKLKNDLKRWKKCRPYVKALIHFLKLFILLRKKYLWEFFKHVKNGRHFFLFEFFRTIRTQISYFLQKLLTPNNFQYY
jgi:ABC-type Fe3+-hydroxamate transport system substrate-binding protein